MPTLQLKLNIGVHISTVRNVIFGFWQKEKRVKMLVVSGSDQIIPSTCKQHTHVAFGQLWFVASPKMSKS